MKDELGQLSNNPQGLLLEAIHSAGYSGALANPLLAPESALNRLDGAILEEFVHVRKKNPWNSSTFVYRLLLLLQDLFSFVNLLLFFLTSFWLFL